MVWRGFAAILRADALVRFAPELRRSQALNWRVRRQRQRLGSILLRTQAVQGVVWPLAVVPLQPRSRRSTGLCDACDAVPPDAFLFAAPKEARDQPVLRWCIGRDALLAEPIERAGPTEAPAQKHQPVIATQNWCVACRSQRTKARQTVHLRRPFRFLCPSAQGKLPADDPRSWQSITATRRP